MRTRLLILTPMIALFTLVLIPTCQILDSTCHAEDTLPSTNKAGLDSLSRFFRQRLDERRAPLYYDLLRSDYLPQRRLNDNPDIQMMYIDERGHPVYYGIENLNAAGTISTDDVWPSGCGGFSLDGSTTVLGELGIWDAGGVLTTHQEITGRVTQMDSPSGTHYHATHVAGTLIAEGVDALAKGMSFQGTLAAYDWGYDDSEMASAAAAGMNASNHSYGSIAGWRWDVDWYWWGDIGISPTEDYGFGFYSSSAQSWDDIAYNAPYYTIVKSAGNDRNDYGPGPGGGHYVWDGAWVWSTDTRDPDGGTDGYDCLPWYANAKNIMTVGAVEDIPGGYISPSDVVMSSFSGWGPTDDGRIKPDLVTNGTGLFSCLDSGPTAYGSLSGTSMSSPNLAGSLNLLIRHYEATHGDTTPLSSTTKAILIHTADEAGPSQGPDFMFGWGLVNTLKAAKLIGADSDSLPRVAGNSLSNGESDEYYFSTEADDPIRVTLAWTDPSGTPPSPSLDPTTLMLVNDLDVRAEHIGTSSEYYPYVLDPQNPSYAATTGDNFRDNVEQIHIDAPLPGDYVVSVTHKGTLTGSQTYSIVISVEAEAQARVAVIKADGSGQFPTIQEAIDLICDGWIIELMSGTYTGAGNKNLDFKGRSITLRSQSGDPTQCIIDCEGDGRGFYFNSDEGRGTIVDGITIRNGDVADSTVSDGGGIYCDRADPTIRNCIIEGNNASSGGGVSCQYSSMVLTDCIIRDNYAVGGGGIACHACSDSLAIKRCEISDNMITTAGGAGLRISSCSGVILTDCLILGNTNAHMNGAGFYISSSSVFVQDCTIAGNNSSQYGGGLYCLNSTTLLLEGCTITGNSGDRGGGLYCEGTAVANLMGCTIADNYSMNLSSGAGAYCEDESAIIAEGTIFWGNCDATTSNQIHLNGTGTAASFGCCDVLPDKVVGSGDVTWGSGNIALDPQFCDEVGCGAAPSVGGDYRIAPSSPCAAFTDPNPECDLIGSMPVGCEAWCPTPTLISPANGSVCQDTVCELCWYPCPDVTRYELRIGTGCGSGDTYTTSGTCKSVSGLSEGTTYYWQVRADTGGAWSEWSPCWYLSTLPSPLLPPTLVFPGHQDTVSVCPVTLVWDNLSGAVLYELQIGTEPDCGSGDLFTSPTNTYDFDCEGDTTYYWRVRAKDECDQWSGWSSECRSFSTPSPLWIGVTSGPLGDVEAGRGVAWGDYDNDGDLDLYITNSGAANKLLRNDDSAFVDVTTGPLGDVRNGEGVAWGDFDNDGDLDLYYVNNGGNRLLRNDGGSFVDVTSGPLGNTDNGRGVAWLDYNNDGDLDLYVVNYNRAGMLLRNNGDSSFTDVTTGVLVGVGSGTGLACGDYDNDGDVDIYLAGGTNNKLLRNDGDGVFTDVTSAPLNEPGISNGVAWGDYDNDGDLDLYISNDGSENKLLRNDGVGGFVDVTAGPLGDSGAGTGVGWADYDNDGDLDLYLVNSGTQNKLFRNDGGTFVDATSVPINDAGNGSGVAWGDSDGDGDLDLYLVNDGANRLFRNDVSGGHWLQVNLVGVRSNTAGIGARVRVFAGGQSQIREISGGSGYLSQNSLAAEFGLGTVSVVDSIEVRWPSGIVQDTAVIAVDQIVTMVEFVDSSLSGSKEADDIPVECRLHPAHPNPFKPVTTIRYDLAYHANVKIQVYDVAGRLVCTLEESPAKEPGRYAVEWNSRDESGYRVAPGVYFCRFAAGSHKETGRMVLLR